jgi:hypothetical protein
VTCITILGDQADAEIALETDQSLAGPDQFLKTLLLLDLTYLPRS